MRALLFALFALMAAPLAAQDKAPPAPYANVQLEDAALEAQATDLMETLRCLTCQSQSIADSDAPIAGDMRHQVRVRLKAGQSPDEVRDWLVDRYGDYVTYTPQVSSTTWPLFAVPALVIVLVLLVLWRRLRGRKVQEGGGQ
ncbi:cytochrome c-type biogenesis protein [Erythrobacter sp. YT30]|uniref:cytochrome c-type biogenesis protein n=1 Tax=Erythrobacter sp. YT30 TaxID=1735012 RepID=UPI00076CD61C|nr:cytochrome c-type biogenesis protein [Erythrobacter sp. YT30]KWV92678.1 cytochrome C biogenesis protein [Erythrobacter sp. YT30]